MSAHSITSRGLAGRKIPQGTLTPMGTLIFSASEPGAWDDLSDLSTLFQDAAGTTPVTAVEQPVGRILDKSGRGNHATQSTTTKRPVLSRRVNLVLNSEFGGAVAGAPGTPPTGWVNGAVTGALVESATGIRFVTDGTRRTINSAFSVMPNGVIVARVKGVVSTSGVSVQVSSIVGNPHPAVIVGVSYKVNGVAVAVNYVMPVGAFDIECTLTASASGGSSVLQVGLGVPAASTGDVTLLTASLTLATDANLPYQRVNTATDYDADPIKFPAYRKLDGVDDSHVSATGGGGTAGFFFSASVTPQGGAGTARTLFSDAGTNTGYIVRLNASNQLELAAGNGTAYTTIATAGTLAVGSTDIVQAWDDGTNLNVKIGNGATASVARPTVSAGTAGYTMGQDNGASTGYFNGRVYSTIYRKDSGLTQVQREAVALYQRQKARMP